MTFDRLVGIGLCIAVASLGASAQTVDRPRTAPATNQQSTLTTPSGGVLPWRRVETRTESAGRRIVTETVERQNVEGVFRPCEQTRTETVVSGSAATTTRELFGVGDAGQRTLLERTRSEEKTFADGSTSLVETTWAPDVTGGLGVVARLLEEVRVTSPTAKRIDTTILRPGVNGALEPTERSLTIERQLGPDVLRSETTRSLRDVNGRFQTDETRTRQLRTTGPSDSVEEETVLRRDEAGKLTVSERTVVRSSEARGRQETIRESFSVGGDGVNESDRRLKLRERVRTITTPVAGGDEVAEDIEARPAGAPNEPMRLTRRTVETVRRADRGRVETVTEVFELDANSRLVLIARETRESTHP